MKAKIRTVDYYSILIFLLAAIMFGIEYSRSILLSYLLYIVYLAVSVSLLLIVIRQDIFNNIGKIIHGLVIILSLMQCYNACSVAYNYSQIGSLEVISLDASPSYGLPSLYVFITFITSWAAPIIGFLVKPSGRDGTWRLKAVTISYLIIYYIGHSRDEFWNRGILDEAVYNGLIVYVHTSFFPVLYFLTLRSLIHQGCQEEES